jgi:hypothetical protein
MGHTHIKSNKRGKKEEIATTFHAWTTTRNIVVIGQPTSSLERKIMVPDDLNGCYRCSVFL